MILTIHLILVLQRTGLLLGKKQSPQNKSSTIRQDKKVWSYDKTGENAHRFYNLGYTNSYIWQSKY